MSTLAEICSVIGFLITVLVFLQTRDIRRSFLRKARLPEVNKELAALSRSISGSLSKYNSEKRIVAAKLAECEGLLENLRSKLPATERKATKVFLASLNNRKWFFFKSDKPVSLTANEAWNHYEQLSKLIVRLKQLEKDTKWD